MTSTSLGFFLKIFPIWVMVPIYHEVIKLPQFFSVIKKLAQVSYPYGASVQDAIWKHKYDLNDFRNQSLSMDIKILIKTVMVVILRKGQ